VKDCVVTSFGPTETSSHGNIWLVLARPRNWSRSSEGLRRPFLRANRDIFTWQHTTCLGPPKELITSREGPHHQFLRANWDIFAWQHVNSHGSPKESTKATGKILFLSLASWSSVTYLYFQYYSIYRFATSTTWSLLKGLCSHTSSTILFTGSQLVLRTVYWRGLDQYFQYYSIYWFTTGTTCSLLKGLLWQNQLELYRLTHASPFQRAPTYFKRYNPLVCRVASR
jgi:hypothetical protein